MGLSPQLWGASGWRFIHYVALAYPENPTKKHKVDYYLFLHSLENVLPCPFCADNFAKKMEEYPPNLNSRQEFFEWTVDMHNFVNVQNGKRKMSYEQAYKSLEPDKIDLSFIPYIVPSIIMLSLSFYTIKKNK